MMDTISIAARVTMSCIVFTYFVMVPLKSRFRYGALKTTLFVALLIAITVADTVLFLSTGRYLVNYSSIGICIWLLSAVLIFRVLIKGSYLEILFIVLVVLNLYVNIMAIVKTLALSMGFQGLTDIRCIGITAAVIAVYIPFLYVLMMRLYKRVVEFNINLSFWKYIWIVPAMTYMIFYVKIINDYWRQPISDKSEAVAFIILWSFVTYAFFWVTLEMLIQAYLEIGAMEKMKWVTTQLQMQEGQYQRLLENMEHTARLRHDWRHHLLSISGFVNNGDIENLSAYINDLYPEYVTDRELSLCENHVVDIILLHYMAKAKAEGIEMKAHMNLPESAGITEIDLCIIFGNLVENAMEACMKKTEGKRYIEVKADMNGARLTVMVKNAYQEPACINGNSMKHAGAGLGLPSVEKIAEKYEGRMSVECDRDYFYVYLMLFVPDVMSDTSNHS